MWDGSRLSRIGPLSLCITALAVVACINCGERRPASARYQSWVTEPEFDFGDDPDNRVLLSQVPYLRAAPSGQRVFVIDLVDVPVSVWTPEGALVFAAKRGQGPGEFAYPTRIYVDDDDGFVVREGTGSRFTYYSEDASLIEAAATPLGSIMHQQFQLELEAPTIGGGYLGTANIPLRVLTGTAGAPPVERSPLLLLQPSEDGEWDNRPEIVFWLDNRNRFMAVPMGEQFRNGFVFGGQPFNAADQVEFEPGRMVVMRTDPAAGEVEFIELNEVGDTVWKGALHLEPMRVTDRMVEAAWEAEPRSPAIPEAAYRRAWNTALHRPDYVPAVRSFFLAASGEIWVRTREESDTLRVYYAMSRKKNPETPRQVLVPEWLTVHDATDSHVWGIRRDALGTPRVVGRKLVPPTQ